MAQRKQGVIKNLQINQYTDYEFMFRGKTFDELFGIGEYNFNFYRFKIKSWIRIEMYRLAQEIVDNHINSTYFSRNILNQKNVHVLISLLVSIAKHGFSKRIRHDFEMHWNANCLDAYGNSRFMHYVKDQFAKFDNLINT